MVDVAAYIERSNQAKSQDEAFELFRTVAADMGFTRSLFAGASNDAAFRERYSIVDGAPIIINNYPDDWTRYYLERQYIAVDPVFASIQAQWGPVVWDSLPETTALEGLPKRVMDEANESGLRNGVSIPLHGPNGDAFIMSLASDDGGDLGLRANLGQVRMVATQFFYSLTDIWKANGVRPQVPALTPRERECLQWTAVGKSAWEIGQILHISEATVRFHLSNAFTRLGASNRIAAVVRAVRWGLVTV